jgi:hypothetical protein
MTLAENHNFVVSYHCHLFACSRISDAELVALSPNSRRRGFVRYHCGRFGLVARARPQPQFLHVTADAGRADLRRREQVDLGIGHDQAIGEELREIAHDPFAGPGVAIAEALEIAD